MRNYICFGFILYISFTGILYAQTRTNFAIYKETKLCYSTERPLPGKYEDDLGKLKEDCLLVTEYGELYIPKGTVVHSYSNHLTGLTFINNDTNTLTICGMTFCHITGIWFHGKNYGISSFYSHNPSELYLGKYLFYPNNVKINEFHGTIWYKNPPPYDEHKTISIFFDKFPENIILDDGTQVIISPLGKLVPIRLLMDIETETWYLSYAPLSASAKVNKLIVKKDTGIMQEYNKIIVSKDWVRFLSGE
jgi:hypothetical protein